MEYKSTFKNSLIYIFRINDTAHKGCVKIGEATAPDGFFDPNSKELNDAAKKRINSYTKTAGIKYELLYTEATAYIKNGHWMMGMLMIVPPGTMSMASVCRPSAS